MKVKAIQFSGIIMIGVSILLIDFTSNIVAEPHIIHVNRSGSGAPDGSINNPYQLLEAGVCKAKPNDTVLIRGGAYPEQIAIGKRVTLKATGENAVIGQVTSKPHTTLKVLTYNVHLYGEEIFFGWFTPDHRDWVRAKFIGDKIIEEDADVVGLQEVWDEDLAEVIINRTANRYPYHYYSTQEDELTDALNTGLLLLSKHRILWSRLIYYDEEKFLSLDAFASKGFMIATIEKDGFRIDVFNTHTESSSSDVREEQLKEMKKWIEKKYKDWLINVWDNHEVIVIGDFNVNGNSSEYNNTLMPILGMKDSFRNAPCFDKKLKFTYLANNDLVHNFNYTKENLLLDYVFYSHGKFFNVIPINAEVKPYKAPSPIIDGDESSEDLSDHYGLAVEFSLFRDK